MKFFKAACPPVEGAPLGNINGDEGVLDPASQSFQSMREPGNIAETETIIIWFNPSEGGQEKADDVVTMPLSKSEIGGSGVIILRCLE